MNSGALLSGACLLLLAAPALAGDSADWRGIPLGVFIDASGFDEAGAGDAPREDYSVLKSTSAPSLDALGGDVIRFSSSPLKAKTAFEIELHRTGGGAAGALITFTLAKAGWRQAKVRRFTVSAADYDRLAALIDPILAATVQRYEGDEIIACGDDPVFVTERLHDGEKRWLSGSYLVPNYTIAKALLAAANAPAFDPVAKGSCVAGD